MNPNSPQSRRTFLKRGSAAVAGSAVAGGLPLLAMGAESALADADAANPVVFENTLTDQKTWSSKFQATNITTRTTGWARRPSVDLGEAIDLVIFGPQSYLPSPDDEFPAPLETATVELYRLGYYGGAGGRLVWKTPAPVSTWQKFDGDGNPSNYGDWPADSPSDPSTGLLGFGNFHNTVHIPGDVIPQSGVYIAKVIGSWYDYPGGSPAVLQTGEAHIIFVVRDDNRQRDILAVLPTNTWQAYNYSTGRSLYTYNSRYGNAGSVLNATGSERAAKVALDRPYNNFIGDLNWVLRTEFPAIYWLEKHGYDVAYTEDVALHFDGAQALPDSSKSLMILGHGEYWSKEIRDAVEGARDAGTNIYNLGANTGYWRVRYEQVDGRPATNQNNARVMVCYKVIEGGGAGSGVAGQNDPVAPTTTWRDPGKGPSVSTPGTAAATPTVYAGNDRPERSLFGVQYLGDDDTTDRPLTVPADNGAGEFAGHQAWRFTTMPKAGKSLGTQLLGWEWDGVPAAGQPFSGSAPATGATGALRRLSQTDPRASFPAGSDAAYLYDGGRLYGTRGAGANVPTGWNPYSHAVTYRAPSGAYVFSAGTIQWSWGLGPHFLHKATGSYAEPAVDSSLPEISQAMANLLYDGGNMPATPVGLTLGAPNSNPTTPPVTTTPPVGTTPRATTPVVVTTPKPDTTAPAVTVTITNGKLFLTSYILISKSTRTMNITVTAPKTETEAIALNVVLSDSVGVMGTVVGSVLPGKSLAMNLVIDATAFKRVEGKLYLTTQLDVTATDAAGNAKLVRNTPKIRAA